VHWQIADIPVLPHAEDIPEIRSTDGKGPSVENRSSQLTECLRLSLQNLSQISEDRTVFQFF